jgi:ADP-L-glycero-D-manno-heptose 6-epimerase
VRLIYASSASVYGNGERGFSDDEADAEHPLNGYAFSKWVFDCHVRRLAAAGVLRQQVVGLRYFNVYGPQEWHKGDMCSPILHFHRQIQAEGKLKLFAGSDDFQRDFVTVEDCCALNAFFLDHPALSGVFNCGTGSARSFADVARLMVARYPGAAVLEVPFPNHLKEKYQSYTCADLRKLRAIGYDRSFTELDDGVAAYVDLLRSPARGYLPL